jgi:hypothetical protein
MMNPIARGVSLPVIAQLEHAGAKYVGKLEAAFRAALGQLYAAHMEKAQMRLAPTRADRLQRLNAGRSL